ncbi:GNAT family N-acetyltransferase [Wenxinia marina]|uniref:L-ornithine N(alpha)-acyltransferase n=1 Tax=Wenxinia marina DSM 24838 TaxID=1123501 RepID=A0A0D0NHF2_9RHOB|nr:GNAT family N-acetyltransferase [Wenxinia marina]KIQ67740.1 ornithine-acyl[acyl carrier protein] N-acyltransferase [Wenxinia marina DSM 24838]GGL77601.1 ornithine-acyl-ACP acyltransferase [Wenxinia marina]
MLDILPDLTLRLAAGPQDQFAVERLRYRVFVEEMGGDGPLVDHDARRERDGFDAFARSLILVDPARPEGEHVVGAYRLLDTAAARRAGQFYSEGEFDLAPLHRSGRRLMELGRTCLHPDWRGGPALWRLWSGLARLIAEEGTEILFGTASFPGTDVSALAQPLALLQRDHLAPEALRARTRRPVALPQVSRIDRRAAMLATPSLIKSYLRVGGRVGEGAFVDAAFNTTDVLMILDTGVAPVRQRALLDAARA